MAAAPDEATPLLRPGLAQGACRRKAPVAATGARRGGGPVRLRAEVPGALRRLLPRQQGAEGGHSAAVQPLRSRTLVAQGVRHTAWPPGSVSAHLEPPGAQALPRVRRRAHGELPDHTRLLQRGVREGSLHRRLLQVQRAPGGPQWLAL
eukprot:5631186-Alexandrium_andersonii.AAC.1